MGEPHDQCRAPTLRSLSRLLLAWEKAERGAAERTAAAHGVDDAAEMVRLAAEIAAHRELLSRLCRLLEYPEEMEPLVPRDQALVRTTAADTRVLSLVRQQALGQ